MSHSRKIMMLFLICLFFSACMPWAAESQRSSYRGKQAKGVYHRVKPGENLFRIARAYQVSVHDLAESNNLSDTDFIEAGALIFIPDATQVIDIIPPAGKSTVPVGAGKKQESDAQVKPDKEGMTVNSQVKNKSDLPVKEKIDDQQPVQFDRERFIWPLKGNVICRFGIQPNGMYYNGITIAAEEGTPILAAADGTVIFSSYLKNYGETMIIKHDDSYSTVYTNLGSRIKKVDDKVKKGEQIAFSGKLQKEGETCVNFEIRHKNKAQDPLFFLP